jgi:hypothetical protein
MGLRAIARQLSLSRNTVRAVIEQRGQMPRLVRKDKISIDRDLLQRLHEECDGWKQRIHEKLVEEEGIEVKYSTLTRLLRELGIGRVPEPRCDQVPDKPGAEMQHDTSPFQVKFGPTLVRVIASLLYLRYSKRRYLKFYRVFNRFLMKCFFHEALMFWGHAAKDCIIDNTNLARLRGTGRDAVIVPEMEAFAKQYGFQFVCHEIGHSNRKAGEERSFFTVESNFLAGRRFESLEDLNEQAFEWSTVRLFHRPLSKSRLIPAKLFEHERPYLTPLPSHLPAPYLALERLTDQYGYISFDGNFYWVPGTERDPVRVLQYSDRLQIYRKRELLTEYRLPPDGVKNERFSPDGFPKPRYGPNNLKNSSATEEQKLRAIADIVGSYLDFALDQRGLQRHRFMKRLFALSQQMPTSLFIRSLERALKYRITCLDSLRRIALLYINESTDVIPQVEVDESYKEREAYREGHLTDDPDFSSYDNTTEEDHE